MKSFSKRSLASKALVLSLCLVSLLLLLRCAREEKSSSLAPDFTLQTLDGEEITLSKLKGKAILLDFWATWCGPCREAVPHLVEFYESYQDRGFEVIGLNLDKSNPGAVRTFVKSFNIPYPIVIAPDEVVRNYGVTGLPTTILIDKEGKIREKIVGFNTTIAKQMGTRIAELTAEKTP